MKEANRVHGEAHRAYEDAHQYSLRGEAAFAAATRKNGETLELLEFTINGKQYCTPVYGPDDGARKEMLTEQLSKLIGSVRPMGRKFRGDDEDR